MEMAAVSQVGHIPAGQDLDQHRLLANTHAERPPIELTLSATEIVHIWVASSYEDLVLIGP